MTNYNILKLRLAKVFLYRVHEDIIANLTQKVKLKMNFNEKKL